MHLSKKNIKKKRKASYMLTHGIPYDLSSILFNCLKQSYWVSVVRVCVCVYVCGFVYAVDRLHDLSGETESVYANVVKQPGNLGLVRVKT